MPTHHRDPRRALGALLLALGSAALLVSSPAAAAEGELTPVLKDSDGNPFGYVVYVPVGYAAAPQSQRFPALIFLPGLGEVGNAASDSVLLDKMTANGPCKLIEAGSQIFQNAGVIVFCIQTSDQLVSGELQGVQHAMTRHLFERYRIDPERLYATGLSAGGGGIWRWGATFDGHRLAAQINVCGNSDPFTSPRFNAVASMIVTSWGDGTNPRSRPIGWTNRLADQRTGMDIPDVMATYPNTGGDTNLPAVEDMTGKFVDGAFTWVSGRNTANDTPIRLVMYTDNSHDSWTRTYNDATVWAWLFAQSRTRLPGLTADSIIVDNLDPGFTATGTWDRVETMVPYWGFDMAVAGAGATFADFSISLPEDGDYAVGLNFVSGNDRAQAVPVTITSAAGDTTVMVDMRTGTGFLDLGTYSFAAALPAKVRIAAGGGVVVADAVAFTREGASTLPDAGPNDPDAAVPLDGDGAPIDIDAAPLDGDGGPGGGGGADDGVTGGCGCQVGGRGPSAAMLGAGLFGLVALLLGRRRRR